MNLYNKFNQYIYNYFFNKEKRGETIIMAVDTHVMDDFYNEFNTNELEFRNYLYSNFGYNWYWDIFKEAKIPQVIGFIAVQIYVAHLMHKGEGHTEKAYRPRYAEFLGIDEGYDLKYLFESCQDKAWKMLREWADRNDFIMHIPIKEDLVWNRRYVTYPLSQALLNQEDLNKAPLLFEKVRLKPNESISFKDFTHLIDSAERRTIISGHYTIVKDRLLRDFNSDNLLKYQLFDFYNNKWDGYYLQELDNGQTKKKNTKVIHNQQLILDKDLETLLIYDANDNPLQVSFSTRQKNLFKKLNKYYQLPHEEVIIFKLDNDYGDYIETRYLETNSKYILICKLFSYPYSCIKKLDNQVESISNSFYSIFRIEIGKKASSHHYWRKIFSSGIKNYSIGGGLKLSRKVWMLNAGPTIKFESVTKVFLNGKRLEIDSKNLTYPMHNFPEGTYVMIEGEHAPERFRIEVPHENLNELKDCGWHINQTEGNWESCNENYQLSGMSTLFPIQIEQATVRNWISALTKPTQKINRRNSSIVVNAIKQSKYGI